MGWILAALVAVVGGAVVLVTLLLPRGTLYWGASYGYRAWSRVKQHPRATDRTGVERAIAALQPRDRYESLLIGVDEDLEHGLWLFYWHEPLSINLSFTIATEGSEEAWVRAYFAERGIACEVNDYNEGMGPTMEARSLDFPVGTEADLAAMTFEILGGLYGPADVDYVLASADQDGPGDGFGFIWRRHHDRLEGVL